MNSSNLPNSGTGAGVVASSSAVVPSTNLPQSSGSGPDHARDALPAHPVPAVLLEDLPRNSDGSINQSLEDLREHTRGLLNIQRAARRPEAPKRPPISAESEEHAKYNKAMSNYHAQLKEYEDKAERADVSLLVLKESVHAAREGLEHAAFMAARKAEGKFVPPGVYDELAQSRFDDLNKSAPSTQPQQVVPPAKAASSSAAAPPVRPVSEPLNQGFRDRAPRARPQKAERQAQPKAKRAGAKERTPGKRGAKGSVAIQNGVEPAGSANGSVGASFAGSKLRDEPHVTVVAADQLAAQGASAEEPRPDPTPEELFIREVELKQFKRRWGFSADFAASSRDRETTCYYWTAPAESSSWLVTFMVVMCMGVAWLPTAMTALWLNYLAQSTELWSLYQTKLKAAYNAKIVEELATCRFGQRLSNGVLCLGWFSPVANFVRSLVHACAGYGTKIMILMLILVLLLFWIFRRQLQTFVQGLAYRAAAVRATQRAIDALVDGWFWFINDLVPHVIDMADVFHTWLFGKSLSGNPLGVPRQRFITGLVKLVLFVVISTSVAALVYSIGVIVLYALEADRVVTDPELHAQVIVDALMLIPGQWHSAFKTTLDCILVISRFRIMISVLWLIWAVYRHTPLSWEVVQYFARYQIDPDYDVRLASNKQRDTVAKPHSAQLLYFSGSALYVWTASRFPRWFGRTYHTYHVMIEEMLGPRFYLPALSDADQLARLWESSRLASLYNIDGHQITNDWIGETVDIAWSIIRLRRRRLFLTGQGFRESGVSCTLQKPAASFMACVPVRSQSVSRRWFAMVLLLLIIMFLSPSSVEQFRRWILESVFWILSLLRSTLSTLPQFSRELLSV